MTGSEPLRVTAWMAAPLAGDVPKLDALVEWAMSFHLPAIRPDLPRLPRGEAVAEPGQIPIPIERIRIGRWPVPRASAGITSPPAIDAHDHFHRSLAVVDARLTESRVKLDTGGGPWRSYRLPLRIRAVGRIVWYCVGVRKALRRWLRDLAAVGKKTAYGYGRVAAWEVDRVEEDWSWFAPSPEGPVLMRPLPAGAHLPRGLLGARPWYGGCCAPYWQRDFWTEIVEPC